MNEYPKAVAALIVAIVLFFGKKFLPDLITSELEVTIYTVVLGIVIMLFGRYTRMSKTEAGTLDKIKNPY